MENVLSGRVPLLPFNVATIINFDKAVWSFNHQLFVFDSLEELKHDLRQYFDSLGGD